VASRGALRAGWTLAIPLATAMGLSSCAWAASDLSAERYTTSPQARPNSSATDLVKSDADHGIADRSSRTILSEAQFAESIVGKHFHYRSVGSDLVLVSPGEYYSEDGRYSVGHRAISQGTYSFERGVISIKCAACREFLGLGLERLFFRHAGRLLMANADGHGSAIELIRSQ
jgi:hypothetical protein